MFPNESTDYSTVPSSDELSRFSYEFVEVHTPFTIKTTPLEEPRGTDWPTPLITDPLASSEIVKTIGDDQNIQTIEREDSNHGNFTLSHWGASDPTVLTITQTDGVMRLFFPALLDGSTGGMITNRDGTPPDLDLNPPQGLNFPEQLTEGLPLNMMPWEPRGPYNAPSSDSSSNNVNSFRDDADEDRSGGGYWGGS